MTPDKHVAERVRFARVLGTSPEGGSGLPVGSSCESEPNDATERAARGRERDHAREHERHDDHRDLEPEHEYEREREQDDD